MTHVPCRLTAKNRDQLLNPAFGNRVWTTFTFYTCNKLRTSSHNKSTVVSVVNELDRRRVLLTTRSTCRRKILSSEFRAKFQKEVHSFPDVPDFLYNTVYDRWKEALMQKNQFDSSSSFNTIPACDGQTDRQAQGHG